MKKPSLKPVKYLAPIYYQHVTYVQRVTYVRYGTVLYRTVNEIVHLGSAYNFYALRRMPCKTDLLLKVSYELAVSLLGISAGQKKMTSKKCNPYPGMGQGAVVMGGGESRPPCPVPRRKSIT